MVHYLTLNFIFSRRFFLVIPAAACGEVLFDQWYRIKTDTADASWQNMSFYIVTLVTWPLCMCPFWLCARKLFKYITRKEKMTPWINFLCQGELLVNVNNTSASYDLSLSLFYPINFGLQIVIVLIYRLLAQLVLTTPSSCAKS